MSITIQHYLVCISCVLLYTDGNIAVMNCTVMNHIKDHQIRMHVDVICFTAMFHPTWRK